MIKAFARGLAMGIKQVVCCSCKILVNPLKASVIELSVEPEVAEFHRRKHHAFVVCCCELCERRVRTNPIDHLPFLDGAAWQ